MNKFSSIFGQILQIFDKCDFLQAIRDTHDACSLLSLAPEDQVGKKSTRYYAIEALNIAENGATPMCIQYRHGIMA
jgi:hypothetical protein